MVGEYVLIKGYNPAYGYWLRAELKKRRIMGDRDYSWKEAQGISMDMHERGVNDSFFEKYFAAWTDAPDYSPDYFHLLRMLLPIEKDGKLNLELIAQLDSEAKKRGGRIIFAPRDAAQDFNEFYDTFLTEPLSKDLKAGVEVKTLLRYFEYDEFTKIPGVSVRSEDKRQEAERRVASELLQWLKAITPDKILGDIKQTLDQHYDEAAAQAGPEHSYNLKSEYVHLSSHKSSSGHDLPRIFLTPSRGRSAIKERHEGVFYSTYYVLKS